MQLKRTFVERAVLSLFVASAMAGSAAAACAIPNDLSNGQTADATEVMENFSALTTCADALAPAGPAGAVQFKGASGNVEGLPLTAGQLAIGSAGAPPQAGSLTAGPGIAILSGSGSLTISALGSSPGPGVDWLNENAVTRPQASSFTLVTSTTAPTGATLQATTRGMALRSSASASGTGLMAETATPAGSWQATVLAVYSGSMSTSGYPAIVVRDSSSNRAVEFGISAGSRSSFQFTYSRTAGGNGLDTILSQTGANDVGLPPPSQPVWSRLAYNGTSFIWSYSRDGENFVKGYTVNANDNLTTADRVGLGTLFSQSSHADWPSAYHILSWSLVAL